MKYQALGHTYPRSTPGSSATSTRDISPPQSDAKQRGSLIDWTSSRPTTRRSWDEVHGTSDYGLFFDPDFEFIGTRIV